MKTNKWVAMAAAAAVMSGMVLRHRGVSHG